MKTANENLAELSCINATQLCKEGQWWLKPCGCLIAQSCLVLVQENWFSTSLELLPWYCREEETFPLPPGKNAEAPMGLLRPVLFWRWFRVEGMQTTRGCVLYGEVGWVLAYHSQPCLLLSPCHPLGAPFCSSPIMRFLPPLCPLQAPLLAHLIQHILTFPCWHGKTSTHPCGGLNLPTVMQECLTQHLLHFWAGTRDLCQMGLVLHSETGTKSCPELYHTYSTLLGSVAVQCMHSVLYLMHMAKTEWTSDIQILIMQRKSSVASCATKIHLWVNTAWRW